MEDWSHNSRSSCNHPEVGLRRKVPVLDQSPKPPSSLRVLGILHQIASFPCQTNLKLRVFNSIFSNHAHHRYCACALGRYLSWYNYAAVSGPLILEGTLMGGRVGEWGKGREWDCGGGWWKSTTSLDCIEELVVICVQEMKQIISLCIILITTSVAESVVVRL